MRNESAVVAHDEEGVGQRVAVDGVCEDDAQVFEGEPAVGVDEAAFQDLQDRPEKKRREKGGGERENDAGESA